MSESIKKTIAKNIKRLLLLQDKTQQNLADYLHIGKSVVSSWCTGARIPRMDKVDKMAEYFNVSRSEILDTPMPKYPKPASLKEVPVPHYNTSDALPQIPLFTGGIACGEPILATDEHEMITPPSNIHADFAIYCKGNSMIGANITDGSVVYIRKQSRVDNGQIAAVLIGEDATLKKVYLEKGKLTLMPANPNYPPKTYTGEELSEVIILGLAVGFTTYL